MGKGYQDLEVWRLSMALAKEIHVVTRAFPQTETFGMVSQLRRAAVSVPSNIAEGHGRGTPKAFASFVRTAHGSLNELETLIELSGDFGYLAEADKERLAGDIKKLSVKLANLKNYLVKEDCAEYGDQVPDLTDHHVSHS